MNIIILHGWGQQASDFDMLKIKLETLKDVKSVISFDLPGFGKEPLQGSDWGIPDYATWVNLHIKKYSNEKIVILGHSFGGRLAAYIASQKPRNLKGIILSGAPLLYLPKKDIQIKNKIFKSIKNIFPKKLKSTLYSQELKHAEKSGLGAIWRNAVIFDQSRYLPKIVVPTLFLWGELDTEAPLIVARKALELTLKGQLSIIKNAGHNSFVTHQYLYFAYVKEFLEKI